VSPWVDVARVAIANSDEIKARRAKKLPTMTRRAEPKATRANPTLGEQVSPATCVRSRRQIGAAA
jgi:hypothetical protein